MYYYNYIMQCTIILVTLWLINPCQGRIAIDEERACNSHRACIDGEMLTVTISTVGHIIWLLGLPVCTSSMG